jgi:pimeloyl-ACP methyl ester carboxylesterase
MRRIVLVVVVTVALGVGTAAHAADPGQPSCTNSEVTCKTGETPDGSTWKIELPPNWNGTLLLYSHGYMPPLGPNQPADDFADRTAADYLLAHGFALAGSSYPTTGWAVKEALPDQIGVLDEFRRDFGKPRRTIAWGHSMGGMITADLVQTYPKRFDGALPMCGIVGGGLGLWNQNLDLQFAFKTLMQQDPNPAVSVPASTLQLANVTNWQANVGAAMAALAGAQATPQGRARLALASALFNLPTWYDPTAPEPGPTDYSGQEQSQFSELQIQLLFVFGFRAELESRAGGNPTWNTGVDYRDLFTRSADRREVEQLYTAAGLDLRRDLTTITATPRVSANPAAARYLEHNVAFNGKIDMPVLTLHTSSDYLVVPAHEQSYAAAVKHAGNGGLLRQLWTHRAGHCTFTDGEMLSALNALIKRLDTGRWPDISPAKLNAEASSYGQSFNQISPAFGAPATYSTQPAFTLFTPPQFLRPFVLPPGGNSRLPF